MVQSSNNCTDDAVNAAKSKIVFTGSIRQGANILYNSGGGTPLIYHQKCGQHSSSTGR